MVPFRSNSRRERRSLERNHESPKWQAQSDRYIMTFPIHPLPSMQAPFEESMLDATGETGYVPFPTLNKDVDTRQQLLCRDTESSELEWNFTYNCHWRNHSKGKYHPLMKTLAQIVFGVHLLHQHLEKSVADVADILLKHVNELDSFLQRANEDIEKNLEDMLFRRKCLKVPMEHVNEFDRLLDDRTYRAQLLDGNVTIERTIGRMSELLNDYLADMSTFRNAIQELDLYLSHIGHEWTHVNDDVGRIYSAMCGNTAGWSQFLQSLLAKAERLGVVLVQVSSYCNEIEKRCGAASRRSLIASRSSSRSTNSREAARSFRSFAENKPLPMVPNERPPFMTSHSAGTDLGAEDGASQKHPNSRSEQRTPAQTRTITESNSDESLQEMNANAQLSGPVSAATSNSDVTVSPRNYNLQLETRQAVPSPGRDQHKAYPIEHSDRSDHHVADSRQYLEHASKADSDTNGTIVPKRMVFRGGKGEHSPPLTGKDSAYSSVSGGSFASPTTAHPRSASAQSSYPRAQFGLFPSSIPSTPKHSITGRHGAMSPSLSIPRPQEQPAYHPPQRSHSSAEMYPSSSRRLLKKSSLSSLKRLFSSKKKHGGVDTIVE